MRLLMICFIVFSVGLQNAFANPISDLEKDAVIERVKDYYRAYEKSINELNHEESLRIVDEFFASDFKHYDNGIFSYDKEGFLKKIRDGKNNPPKKNSIRINFLDASVSEGAAPEVMLRFKLYESNQKSEKNTLECSDSIRIISATEFALYKCDCIKY